ncbi:MAG: YceI family protein [Gammaproteobacteria bacterium]|nr:YceI family protein [Gammaproteobacteria bacterium]
MRTLTHAIAFAAALSLPTLAPAADYVIDTAKTHAFIQFRIQHLGYSWLYGRFNKFEGTFSYDEKNPAANKVEVSIDTASVDTNHAERDKHLRSDDFLDVEKFPQAHFVGTKFEDKGDGKAVLSGALTLHGVTKPVVIAVERIGQGDDPWGGYRTGFFGTTTLKLADFNITRDLGPAAQELELMLSVEGIRQQ